MTYLNKPVLSFTFSLLALILGAVMMTGNRFLAEQQSVQMFFVLFPATIVLAIFGYLLGAAPAPPRMAKVAIAGYLLGGAILIAIVVLLLLPVFRVIVD